MNPSAPGPLQSEPMLTSLLYFFQVSVVFLCPAFFGWVVLRRVAREVDWLVLIPGSVVVGSIALMALMNELRYWLEMSIASWFAYKILLASALALLVSCRRPRFPPRLAGGPHGTLWLLAALAGTGMTALYFGIPAARGLLNDAWWFHYPAATLVEDLKNFPLPSVFAPDDPLYYHFGPDILAGTWAFLLDRPVQVGFVALVCIFAPCTFLIGYALLRRACRNQLGALAGATFLVVGGNFLFLRLPSSRSFSGLSLLDRLNSGSIDGLLKLMFTPSHACGIVSILVGIVLFRRFFARPTWAMAALFGLWMGALTLIAEWYFFPFLAAVALYELYWFYRARREPGAPRLASRGLGLQAAVLVIAVGWGFFNNTYVAGVFEHFWMHSLTQTAVVEARMEQSRFDQDLRTAEAMRVYSHLIHKPRLPSVSEGFGSAEDWPLPPLPWTPPGLLPLRLNLHHFGMVPSWQNAGSSGGSFVRVLSFRFLAECGPVMLLGLPFGIWLALRRPNPVAGLLVLVAALSTAPPIFLDWGFRSTDFLRFFTGAFSFSALLLGWLVAWLWGQKGPGARALAIALIVCVLINPFVIGLIGLNGSTFAAVRSVNQSAGSLEKAAEDQAAEKKPGPPAKGGPPAAVVPLQQAAVILTPEQRRAKAFATLAELTRRYLYPQTLGRDRAIVMAPEDSVPPTEVFPEWLKLATLSHVQVPIGWYWNDSYYAAYYREAVTKLTPKSVIALDAKWIIMSNLFGPPPPAPVLRALHDDRRFVFAHSFASGPYTLTIFRALPFGPLPSDEEEK